MAMVFFLSPAVAAQSVAYLVTVNTSSLNGSGFLDFQFNPGVSSLGASASVSAFNPTAGLSSSPVLIGNASGALPSPITLSNGNNNSDTAHGTQLNDNFVGFTFGTSLSFLVTFSGDALSQPNPSFFSGSTFGFSIYSSDGATPLLTTNANGYTLTIDVNPDGSTTVSGFSLAANVVINPNPVPAISSLGTSSVLAGANGLFLNIYGTGFLNGATVQWNGSNRATTFVSSGALGAVITAADFAVAGTFAVTVTNPAPTAGPSNALSFQVINAAPTLTSLSPGFVAAGGAGLSIGIVGSGFVNGAVAYVGQNPRTTVFASSTSLGLSLNSNDLAQPGTLSITVLNPSPTPGASNALAFTVTGNNPLPAIALLSPSTVAAGQASFALNVYGSNFVPNSTVQWGGSARPTTFGSAQQLSATINASDIATAGPVAVTVANPTPGGGISSPITFTVGSSSQGSLAAQSVHGSPGAPVAVPLVLTLNNGATVGALSLGVRVVPTNSAPPIAANLAFQSDPALPVPSGSPPTVAATNTTVAAFFGSFTTSLKGQVAIGVVQVAIPASAAVGQTYDVQVTAADAAQGSAAVPLTNGADTTLTLVLGYLVGDSFPHTADATGSFGDGLLNTLDLIDALRAVTHLSTPPACSDRFDDIDAYPVDTATASGGDGFLNTLDLIETLRRVTNLDTSRPLRTPRGLTCSQTEAASRRARPRETAEGAVQVEGDAIYLLAHQDLNLAGLALSLTLQDGQQGNFTPGDISASVVDTAQPGQIAMAWLSGLKLASGQRLLLGHVNGADRGSVLGISANDPDGREVNIAGSTARVR